MATIGLSLEGFLPDSLYNIKNRIEQKLEILNPGFDFSPESPDGQLIGIVSSEIALVWQELERVYNSYDPNTATGQALRNLGLITGIQYPVATRSYGVVKLSGVVGTVVPRGSYVSNTEGNLFYTNEEVVLSNSPVDVNVIADLPGPVPISMTDPITIIDSVVTGWDVVLQDTNGTEGKSAQEEAYYRNTRNRTVYRNNISSEESLEARLLELGMEQVMVLNNDTSTVANDGTPSRHIHVVVGEQQGITDEEVANVIHSVKGLGVPTYGSTQVMITDSLQHTHEINFTKSVPKSIYLKVNVKFLDEESAGAEVKIKEALAGKINSLLVGEDVIWSRLFEYITPHGKAQVNTLETSQDGVTYSSANISISDTEYANISVNDIDLTVQVV